MTERGIRLVLSAGEASGDQLGADLARALRLLDPEIRLAGIAGPEMQAAGVEAWFDLDALNVMGLAEVVRHLPRLMRLRRSFAARIAAWQPDAFVGIDAPDFNLRLARQLRRKGLKTAHYVAPTVWAWRPGRAARTARAVDLLLALFPFEPALFMPHGLPTRFVGHPLADRIVDAELSPGRRQRDRIVLLPGSRRGEIDRHLELLTETAEWLHRRQPQLTMTMLLARPEHADLVSQHAGERLQAANVGLVVGETRDGLSRAAVAVSASGTATLEAFLLECPLVVFYRLAPLTYGLLKTLRLVRSRHIALPNILVGTGLVPEFVQREARADRLGSEALAWLENPARVEHYRSAAAECRDRLAAGAGENAARAVLELVGHVADRP
ncbi:MAG: lipid-A-disaccharide synthase [Pseudomonadota bacterium]|nr:MAG: lipid-A-disaccharide synthase [Pseudomonadota bacterium]